MFPQKKIKTKDDEIQKQEPYHSETNLLSQTIQWINFLNSEKKNDPGLMRSDDKIEIENPSPKMEKLNNNNFAKFNNITKKN